MKGNFRSQLSEALLLACGEGTEDSGRSDFKKITPESFEKDSVGISRIFSKHA